MFYSKYLKNFLNFVKYLPHYRTLVLDEELKVFFLYCIMLNALGIITYLYKRIKCNLFNIN